MARRCLPFLPPLVAFAAIGVSAALELAAPDGSFGRDLVPGSVWVQGVMGLAIAVLAGVLVADRRHALAAAAAAFAACALVSGLLRAHVHWSVVEAPDGAGQGLVTVLWFIKALSIVSQLFASSALVAFPDGRPVPGWWGRVAITALVGSTLSATVQILGPGTLDFVPVLGLDPGTSVLEGRHVLAAPVIGQVLEPVMAPVLLLAVTVLFGIELVTPVLRFGRSEGREREQLHWILWAVAAIGLGAAVDTIVRGGTLDGWLIGVGTAVLALAMSVALLDQSVVSGEKLLANTLVYGGLWVIVLALDLAFLTALTAALGDSLAQRDVVLLVLFLSATLYGPLRAGLWALVRRWLFGDRGRPYDVVAGLASSLETADEGPEQLAAAARAVGNAFGVSFVSVEVDRAAGAVLTATIGRRPGETRTLPIAYRGTPVGRLVLPAHGLRTQLNRRDEKLFGDLVRQAAAAARTTQLADELQVKREELVLAREEERRRIRRDLHDGLGPALGGAVFQLDSARLLADRAPATAVAQLESTERHLREVMEDVRRLVSDLRPPSLDNLGLVRALQEQGDLVDGVRVRVEAPDAVSVAALPAAVEVAAFRIAGEALTNVARHAGATHCTVRLDVSDGELLVEVADDGAGIAAERQAGVGLLSLRERADELGGRTQITCPPAGGTVLRAWLPCTHHSEGNPT